MGDVEILSVETTLDIPPERVLKGALENNIEGPLLVLGYSPDGGFYCAASTQDAGELLILLERARRFFVERLP